MSPGTERPRGPMRHDLFALAMLASLFAACSADPKPLPARRRRRRRPTRPTRLRRSRSRRCSRTSPSRLRASGSTPGCPRSPIPRTSPIRCSRSLSRSRSCSSGTSMANRSGPRSRFSLRRIGWQGQQIEVAVSQYNAFLDGRITEVAFDLYAQADDGSVWYFGEDVFDFRDGAIVVTEGTWLAGRDGPAAMIMPAHPQVGDVYRPENAPGIVFEEVTVASVQRRLDGPLGPIEGGMLASELHMDGSTEDKLFAPGYGGVLHVRRTRRRGTRAGRPDGRDDRIDAARAHDDVGRRSVGVRCGRIGRLEGRDGRGVGRGVLVERRPGRRTSPAGSHRSWREPSTRSMRPWMLGAPTGLGTPRSKQPA